MPPEVGTLVVAEPDATVLTPASDGTIGTLPVVVEGPAATADAPSAPTQGREPLEEVSPPAPIPDVFALLDTADPKKLRSHPRVAGIVGAELDRRLGQERVKLRAELAEQLQREQETARLRAAAEQDDIVTLGQAKLAEIQAELARERAGTEEVRQRALSLAPNSDAYMALQKFAAKQPAEVLAKFIDPQTGQGKLYPGAPADGFLAYLDDVVTHTAAHRFEQERTALRAQIEKELRASLRAEVLGERNESETSPDLTAGRPNEGVPLTLDRYNEMSPSDRRKLRKEHPELVDAMARAGMQDPRYSYALQ